MKQNQRLRMQIPTSQCRTAIPTSFSSQSAVAQDNVAIPVGGVESTFPALNTPGEISTSTSNNIQNGNNPIPLSTVTTTTTGMYNRGNGALVGLAEKQFGALNNIELGRVVENNRQQPVSIQIPSIIPSLNAQLFQQPTGTLVTNSNNNSTSQGNDNSQVAHDLLTVIVQSLLTNPNDTVVNSQEVPNLNNP